MNTAVFEQVYKFKGLSTETKPDCNSKGSVFEETDTGKTYRFDGTAWVEVEEDSGGGAFCVTFTVDDSGDDPVYSADKTYEEIVTAIEAGNYVYGALGNDRLQMSSYIEDSEIWFSLAYNDNNVLITDTIVINSDDTVPISETYAAYDLSSLIVES